MSLKVSRVFATTKKVVARTVFGVKLLEPQSKALDAGVLLGQNGILEEHFSVPN